MQTLLEAYQKILESMPDARRIELRDGAKALIAERSSPETVFCPPPPIMPLHHAPPPSPVRPEAPPPPAASPAVPSEPKGTEQLSPIVGTFYAAPAPDAAPFVTEGQRVEKGQILCIIEAMKMLNEIEAETGGIVREICVKNGDLVEYGQKLFVIV